MVHIPPRSRDEIKVRCGKKDQPRGQAPPQLIPGNTESPMQDTDVAKQQDVVRRLPSSRVNDNQIKMADTVRLP